MGLDMYLYHVKKSDLVKNKLYEIEDVRDNGNTYSQAEYDTLPDIMKERCTKILVKNQYINLKQILVDNDFDPDDSIHTTGISSSPGGNAKYTFRIQPKTITSIKKERPEKEVTVIINDESKYVYEQVDVAYHLILDEIDYQRKGLNDEGWDLLPENCEYCDEKDRIQEMCDVGGLSDSFIKNWIDNETVFLAWW